MLSHLDREELFKLARAAIRYGLKNGHILPIDPRTLPSFFQQRRRVQVRVFVESVLRGSAGPSQDSSPVLGLETIRSAFHACFKDPRYPAMTADEVDRAQLEILVYSDCENSAASTIDFNDTFEEYREQTT